MFTYLYPIAKNDSNDVLEQLAGVPAGTAARLARLEAKFPHRNEDYHPDEQAFFKKLFASDADIQRYRSFIVYGWGKTNPEINRLARQVGEDTSLGHVRLDEHPEIVEQMLLAIGIRPDTVIPFITGLDWG